MATRTNISMTLSKSVKQKLDKVAQHQSLNRSQIVQEAISDYIFKYEFQQLRQQLILKARQQGIYTDEDVFKAVS